MPTHAQIVPLPRSRLSQQRRARLRLNNLMSRLRLRQRQYRIQRSLRLGRAAAGLSRSLGRAHPLRDLQDDLNLDIGTQDDSSPPAEVHIHRQTLHQTGIKFSVQTGPYVDPLPLELYISPDTLDDSRDAIDRSQFTRIRLYSPLAVSSGRALKRRIPNEPGDDQLPAKRRHLDTPFDLQDPPPYTSLEPQYETPDSFEGAPESPTNTYMVDLGLVRAYVLEQQEDQQEDYQSLASVDSPASRDSQTDSQADATDTNKANSDADTSSTDELYPEIAPVAPYPSRLVIRSAAVVATGAIVFLLAVQVVVLIIVPILNSATDALFASSFDLAQLPDSSLRPVDWFQQGIEINIAIATIPRIVLLGEVSQEEPAWRCQPGLRPDSGPLHSLRMPNNLTHDDEPIVPHPDFDSALYPRYKPWETAADGLYIPEESFIQDLRQVLETTLRDLGMIADHGPPSFRFTQGSSTQFRWSTSSNRFMPPHASLPTFRNAIADLLTPASTVPGMPPMAGDQHPSPTARPASVFGIYNLDPALSKLGRDITESLDLVWMTELSLVRDLKFEFPGASRITAAAMVAHLSRLRDQHRDGNGTEAWGSDQQRIDCMFPHITIDLAGSPSATWSTRLRPEGLTDIPSGIPREYLERVFEAHEAGISRSRSFAESASAASSTSSSSPACASPLLHTATDWSWAQADNQTARTLAHILDISLEMDLRNPSRVGEPDDFDYSSHLFQLDPYTDAVEDVCRKLEELDGRIQQVLRSMKEHDWPRTRKAVTRLQDVAPFLNEIARIRICEMGQRARRGLTLLQETDSRLERLRNEIQQVYSDGWTGPLIDVRRAGQQPSLFHFPDLDSLIQQWETAFKWIEDEALSLRDTHRARSFWFYQLRDKRWKDGTPDCVWSRWDMRDARKDPLGSEAFCWQRTDCGGDASLRHGKK